MQSQSRCEQIVSLLKKLPNEILFNIFFQCPKDYLPNVLLKNNYFMNRWYREYYPYYYEEWKKRQNIKYCIEGDKLVKKINNQLVDSWSLPTGAHFQREYYGSQRFSYTKGMSNICLYISNQEEPFCYYYIDNDNVYTITKFVSVRNKTVKITFVHDLDNDELLYIGILILYRKFIPMSSIECRRHGLIFPPEYYQYSKVKKIKATRMNMKDIIQACPKILEVATMKKIHLYSLS